MAAARSTLVRVLGAIRDGWLVIGITLLMFLGLECGYRLVAGPIRPASFRTPPDHPYADSAWFDEYVSGPEGPNARRYLLDPYRLHTLAPMQTRFIGVDSLGRRVTPWSAPVAQARRTVIMLGGSTMWGYLGRDSFTIPALLARTLRDRGHADVAVVNLALPGYNSTQETTTLVHELAQGLAPDVAVYLNGYNDIATALRWNRAGMVYDLEAAQRRLDMTSGVPQQLFGLTRHSRLLGRLLPEPAGEEAVLEGEGEVGPICADVARYYRRIADENAALGRAFGFPVFFLMQPMHHVTAKPLTRYEQRFKPSPRFRRCVGLMDSAMAAWEAEGRYLRAYTWFDQDTVTRFVDRNSHLTEAANLVIAERMADVIAPYLSGTRSPSPPGAP